jgi:hypothetical protein
MTAVFIYAVDIHLQFCPQTKRSPFSITSTGTQTRAMSSVVKVTNFITQSSNPTVFLLQYKLLRQSYMRA